MLTWRLWFLLQEPSPHPMFRRTIRTPFSEISSQYVAWGMLLLTLFACSGFWLVMTRLKSSTAILLFLLMIFFSGTFYVVAWVIGISITIAREHELGTFEQLCLPPSGALGASWAICVASLHRNDTFGWINLMRRIITSAISLVFIMVLLTTLLTQSGPSFVQFVVLFVQVVTLASASYLDHVQSVTVGCLVGMLAPTYVPRRFDARFLGMSAFLALQGAAYFGAWVGGFVILPFVYGLFNFDGWLAGITSALLRLLIFYAMREIIINILWNLLTYRLNDDTRGLRFTVELLPQD